MNKLTALIASLIMLSYQVAAAQTFEVVASGEHAFGPNETQAQACDLALSKAKKNALIKHFGELVGQKSMLECDSSIQKATGNDCELFESSWSLVNSNGFIKGSKEVSKSVGFSETQRANVCEINATFVIDEFSGKPDSSFQTSVTLKNGVTLREGDSPVITIKSNKAAFHLVYFWAPYHDRENYYRIFPNAVDEQSSAVTELTVPSPNQTKTYTLDVSLPEGANFSTEYLILLSFKESVNTAPDTISEAGFFSWLQSIERDLWTQDKISYRIIGDSI